MLHYFKDTWIEWLWLPNIHAETLISKKNWIYIIKEWSRRPFSPPTISGYFRKTACESRMLALYRQSTFIWTLGFTASRTGPWSIVSLNSTIKEQYKRCSYLYRQACIMRHRTLKPVTTPFRDLLCFSERSQKWEQNRYWCPRTGVCSLTKFLF